MKKKEQQMLGEDKNEWFISKAKQVHGDRYDYSKVEYINSRTKVCVICPKHGEFFVRPDIHLGGSICKKCQFENQKRIIFGKGYNNLLEESHTQAYKIWKHVLHRCCSNDTKRMNSTYAACSICDEWLLFSNFKKWFDSHYIDGYHLDKDILVKGNKLYSPNTCCFVPRKINTLLTKSNSSRGKCLIGVTFNKSKGKYEAHVNINGKTKHFGGFTNEYDAFIKYKTEKEKEIVRIANEYKDRINKNVYDALINYKVEITD